MWRSVLYGVCGDAPTVALPRHALALAGPPSLPIHMRQEVLLKVPLFLFLSLKNCDFFIHVGEQNERVGCMRWGLGMQLVYICRRLSPFEGAKFKAITKEYVRIYRSLFWTWIIRHLVPWTIRLGICGIYLAMGRTLMTRRARRSGNSRL